MANIFDVAKYILEKYEHPISAMKLQKLCYYSQAWNLVWEDSALFEEDFQDWVAGPVCWDLFCKHKGMMNVSPDILVDSDLSAEDDRLTPQEEFNIDKILELYGDKSGAWLSELTHKEDPWRITRGDKPDGTISSEDIDKDLIKKYYSSLVNA
jgi:uncharacterized phage-associated protein